MYLLPAGSGARSTTKWGLGGPAFRMRVPLDGLRGPFPETKWRSARMNGLRGPFPESKWRNARMNGLRGLGDAIPDQNILDTGILLPTGIYDPFLVDSQSTQTPQQPGVAPTTQTSIADAYKQVQQAAAPSTDPMDYVSPQAAIAAGLPQQTVYNTWSSSIARFPTQQAALAAGIPAGVVTQLWAQSRSALPATTSFFDGTTFGISNKVLALGAGGIALLAAMRGRR